ncbi:uncharacterized protein EV154DRAFT_488988 [Mucor mucedo]|uniref:uncharacterized protein n=1 Tax=Mucor mucedo TaxID=29922 RepID=UPI002220139A|nr:uncharacterized protein EV154DRAFT_488988 [Mucor mucedo]KAI7864011.1 hypothetical protein EV154DRAFT_488988 [Mucor mucedo]
MTLRHINIRCSTCVVRLSRTAKPIVDNSPYLLLLWYKQPKGEKKRARCNIIYKDSVMIFSGSDGAKSTFKDGSIGLTTRQPWPMPFKKRLISFLVTIGLEKMQFFPALNFLCVGDIALLKLCNYQQAPDNIWCQYWFMGSFLVFFSNLDAVIDLPVMILLDLMPQICFMSNQLSDSIFIIDLSAL